MVAPLIKVKGLAIHYCDMQTRCSHCFISLQKNMLLFMLLSKIKLLVLLLEYLSHLYNYFLVLILLLLLWNHSSIIDLSAMIIIILFWLFGSFVSYICFLLVLQKFLISLPRIGFRQVYYHVNIEYHFYHALDSSRLTIELYSIEENIWIKPWVNIA